MIKNRPLGHIGFGTNDIDATVNYYIDVLGFELIGDFQSPVGEPIKFIKSGDIVSLDAGVIYKGYHSDAARTHAVGEISPEAQKLIEVTK